MAKKSKIRTATVDERTSALVDRGCEIDEQIKRLAVEDKGIKKVLGEEVEKLLQAGETAVRLTGQAGEATVVKVEKFEFDLASESFLTARRALDAGLFGEAVVVRKTLMVPPDKVETAHDLLQRAGLAAMVQVVYEIKTDEFKELKDSRQPTEELQRSVDALRDSAFSKPIMRVTYEGKK